MEFESLTIKTHIYVFYSSYGTLGKSQKSFFQISLTFLPANLWRIGEVEVEVRDVAHRSQVFTKPVTN